MADLRDAPSYRQNFLNLMQFFRKFGEIVYWCHPLGLAPPPTGNPGSAPDYHYHWRRKFSPFTTQSGANPGYPIGGGADPKGWHQHTILPIFPINCLTILGRRGVPLLDTPLPIQLQQTIFKFYTNAYSVIGTGEIIWYRKWNKCEEITLKLCFKIAKLK